MKQKKAFCYLVSNEGRDFYLLIPYIYYLEKYQNVDVQFKFVWEAHHIRTQKPDLVILPNVRGQLLYWEIADYCKRNEILVFHHDSEGNFNTENESYDYWGYNQAHQRYCPIEFTWSQKVKNYLEQKYPIFNGYIAISGATGFDKYQYMSRCNKEELLSKYGKEKFTKVVGYAGWAFGKIYNTELSDLLINLKLDREKGVDWLIKNRDFVEHLLESAIQKYPDVLFILKKHPRENFESDYRDSRNEMNQLTKYPNVLYLKDQEDIQDLISISDCWMAFESTSTMEAWLMNVPTLVLNDDVHFTRSQIYEGSLIVSHTEQLYEALDAIYIHKDLTLFSPAEIAQKRKKIIQNSIGFSDGLNHLRAAYYFQPFLDASQNNKIKPPINLKFLKLYCFLQLGKLFYTRSLFEKIPKLKKNIWAMENYRLSKVKELKTSTYNQLDTFYKKNNLTQKLSTLEFWEKLEK
jgi:surface carbohydrate biosynthesis protein